ncbi:hypothetical protein [Muriicola jejuensis]|uniref:hypothetical protein n=1 Tax=Muriicola jejuensis TaxID=504488 RepID=UPI001EF7D8A2|nr:hypothetical protein [Muriicola jejuensis]
MNTMITTITIMITITITTIRTGTSIVMPILTGMTMNTIIPIPISTPGIPINGRSSKWSRTSSRPMR